MPFLMGAPLPVAVVEAGPSLTAISHTIADTDGGTNITLTGTSLAGATLCSVGSTSATIVSNTSTTLVFTMPAKTAATYNVTVTTAGGVSNALTIEAWSPGELNLTLYLKNYDTAGASWAGRSSAGTSGTRSLSLTSVGQGSAGPEGHKPATFNGTSSKADGAFGTTSLFDAP